MFKKDLRDSVKYDIILKLKMKGNDKMNGIMKTAPAVFAVRDTYQIMVPVKSESLMWVRVGDRCYYDSSSGVLRSDVAVHRMTVPMCALDEAGEYTICYRKVLERKIAFTETEDVVEKTFVFRPVQKGKITLYHIADAHNVAEPPIAAAKAFEKQYGRLDLLVLNGDIIHNSGSASSFDTIYEIAGNITDGAIPVVCSRGNHDNRGLYAEKIADYLPTEHGNTYYSFRLGTLWGLVLDCGEDKPDNHPEYGNTMACHAFREEETAFLEAIIRNAEREYAAEGVGYRMVIVHTPFTQRYEEPFNVEEPLYSNWAKLLKEHVAPDIMLCGHLHELSFDLPGCAVDAFGQPCPIVVGAKPCFEKDYFAGAGLLIEDKLTKIVFNDNVDVLEEYTMENKKN